MYNKLTQLPFEDELEYATHCSVDWSEDDLEDYFTFPNLLNFKSTTELENKILEEAIQDEYDYQLIDLDEEFK